MEPTTIPTNVPWRELEDARVFIDEVPEFSFTLLERMDGHRAGAWFYQGEPVGLVEIAEA